MGIGITNKPTDLPVVVTLYFWKVKLLALAKEESNRAVWPHAALTSSHSTEIVGSLPSLGWLWSVDPGGDPSSDPRGDRIGDPSGFCSFENQLTTFQCCGDLSDALVQCGHTWSCWWSQSGHHARCGRLCWICWSSWAARAVCERTSAHCQYTPAEPVPETITALSLAV